MGVSWGTIEYYSKLSNEEQHMKIKVRRKPIDADVGDMTIAGCLLDYIGDECFLKDGRWYLYDETTELWKRLDNPNDWLSFNHHVYETTKKVYKAATLKLAEELRELEAGTPEYDAKLELNKSYGAVLKKNSTVAKMKSVAEALKTKLSVIKVDYEMDSKSELICFRNTTFNLSTGKQYTRNKYDYLSQSTGYDYKKATNDECSSITGIINKIFPDPDLRKSYASILFTALTGTRPELFIICNGKGRNGKGVINEQLKATLGSQYYYKGKSTTLTQPLKDGATPEIAKLHNKRVTVFTEPAAASSLNVEMVKSLSGDGVINARTLYSEDTACKLTGTLLMECNTIPQINGKIGHAEIKRFCVFMFHSLFVDDIDEAVISDDNIGNKYPMEKGLKEDAHMNKHRCAFFEWILNTAPREVYIAESVKEATKRYLLSCDDIVSFLDETIEYSGYDPNNPDEQYYTTAKELFELYKESEAYKNKGKLEKRKYNQATFKDDLRTNQKFAKYYCDYYRGAGKARDKRAILLGWSKMSDDDDDDFDRESDGEC